MSGYCARCGLATPAPSPWWGWADRHPEAAAVVAMMALGTVLLAAILVVAYPWLLGLLAAGMAIRQVRARRRRAAALGARADWDYRHHG